MTGGAHRIAVVDDHPLLRLALAAELERGGFTVELPPFTSTDQLIDHMTGRSFACAVLDLGLPLEGGGLGLIEPVVSTGTTVVVLTGETERSLWSASIAAGAQVVLAKSEPMADIVGAVVAVCAGEEARPGQRSRLLAEGRSRAREQERRLAPFDTLSPREREVLLGLIAGCGPAELAERDFVSIQTVRTQIKAVLRKLGVRSQLEAVARANASGWPVPPSLSRVVGAD